MDGDSSMPFSDRGRLARSALRLGSSMPHGSSMPLGSLMPLGFARTIPADTGGSYG